MSKSCLWIKSVNIPTLVDAVIPLMLSVANLKSCICGMAIYYLRRPLLRSSTFTGDTSWQGTTPFRLVLTNFLHLQFLCPFRTMAYFLLRVFSREGWKALVIFSVCRNLIAFLA